LQEELQLIFHKGGGYFIFGIMNTHDAKYVI